MLTIYQNRFETDSWKLYTTSCSFKTYEDIDIYNKVQILVYTF